MSSSEGSNDEFTEQILQNRMRARVLSILRERETQEDAEKQADYWLACNEAFLLLRKPENEDDIKLLMKNEPQERYKRIPTDGWVRFACANAINYILARRADLQLDPDTAFLAVIYLSCYVSSADHMGIDFSDVKKLAIACLVLASYRERREFEPLDFYFENFMASHEDMMNAQYSILTTCLWKRPITNPFLLVDFFTKTFCPDLPDAALKIKQIILGGIKDMKVMSQPASVLTLAGVINLVAENEKGRTTLEVAEDFKTAATNLGLANFYDVVEVLSSMVRLHRESPINPSGGQSGRIAYRMMEKLHYADTEKYKLDHRAELVEQWLRHNKEFIAPSRPDSMSKDDIKYLIDKSHSENEFSAHMEEEEHKEQDRCCAELAISEAIHYIIKRHVVLRLRAETAYLAVFYLMKYIRETNFKLDDYEEIRLIAVTSLVLASYWEKTEFQPSDFCVESYTFEVEEIRDEETEFMKVCNWHGNETNPFAFIHFFVRTFCPHLRDAVSRIEQILLSVIQDLNILSHHGYIQTLASVIYLVSEEEPNRTEQQVTEELETAANDLGIDDIGLVTPILELIELQGEFKSTQS